MTPAQREHLRRIDAHLERLLSTAEKRTPGEWEWTDANAVGEPQLTSEGGALVCTVHHECVKPVPELNACADFIASCAGNAEAGWRTTRAAIAEILYSHEAAYEGWCLVAKELGKDPGNLEDYPLPPWSQHILTAFPNV